jgi:hypothetical protein
LLKDAKIMSGNKWWKLIKKNNVNRDINVEKEGGCTCCKDEDPLRSESHAVILDATIYGSSDDQNIRGGSYVQMITQNW